MPGVNSKGRYIAYYKAGVCKKNGQGYLLGMVEHGKQLYCSHCKAEANYFCATQERSVTYHICRNCNYALQKRPKKTNSLRTKSDEQNLHDAQKKIDEILSDISRKMTSLKTYRQRVKRYTAKLEGRLKKYTPKKKVKNPIRNITVE